MDKNTDDWKYLATKLKGYFLFYDNFPKDGVRFWDVFALLKNPDAFHTLLMLLKYYADAMKGKVDVVVGIDARGFLFGPIIAEQLGTPFVPIRKKGKLPGNIKSVTYSLEYGNDTIEIQEGCISKSQRIMIVDDFIATGGTMAASCTLVRDIGAEVVDCLVIYSEPELHNEDKLKAPLTVLLGGI